MPTLRDTQTLFWRLIRAPEGVAATLAAIGSAEPALAARLDAVIRGDERLNAVERLSIYGRMYWFRLLDALAEDFPALHAVIGHSRFHALAEAYLSEHPSEHPSLRQLGRRLPAFLDEHPVDDASAPWLADLARFEWALLDAFDAPDAEPVSADALRALAPEAWADLRLALSPSVRIVRAGAPVDRAWTAAIDGDPIPEIGSQPTILRVWRDDLRVFHRAIDEVEACALEAVASGASFAQVCEALAELAAEEAAARAVAVLQRWFADAIVVGIEHS